MPRVQTVPTQLRYAVQITALAALYFVVAKLSLLSAIPPGYATSVWPPSGIALAVILLYGRRIWPGIWIGAALVNLTVQSSVVAAVMIGSGNAIEALVAAALIKRQIGVPRHFQRGEDVFRFVALSAAAATIAATIGTLAVTTVAALPLAGIAAAWWTWWQGDTTGMIVITPLILAWTIPPAIVWTARRKREVIGFGVVLVLVGYVAFGSDLASRIFSPLLLLLTLPVVTWAALRFDQREVVVTIAILCAMAVGFTVAGRGSLASDSVNASLLQLLVFISLVAMTGLSISAVVNERRRAMEALRESRDEIERKTNEFLAILGHELRNPLAPIRNALSLMGMQSADDSTREWSRNVIDRQLTQLTRLVDDLLDVARITSGKIELEKEHVELNVAVLRAVDSCQSVAEARQQILDVQTSKEHLLVDGDIIRLSQIVLNLLNNAIKYTPDGGRITVSVARDGDWAVLRVKDTGIGIRSELLPKVFDLFVQGERSLARTEGGLGVGLTIVRNLVSLHGGTVSARSDGPGKGSEFIVLLPALYQKEPVNESTTTWQPGNSRTKRRVLIVDDNRDLAATAAALLSASGHDVRTIYDGVSAVATAIEFHPDVVLLDIGLPGMSGYEVARQLRASEQRRSMLLIALTGYGQDADRQRTREAGFDHHLVKPLEPATLEKIVESISVPASIIQ